MSETAEVVCGKVESFCRCVLPPHDDGRHECACGGSWEIGPDGAFTIHSVPGEAEGWPQASPDVFFETLGTLPWRFD